MESLCFSPGAPVTSLPVSFGGASSGARARLVQVSALGRCGAGGVSLQSFLSSSLERKSAESSLPTSFWLAGEKGNDGATIEGSVSVDRGGRKGEEEEDDDDEEQQEEEGLEGGEEEEEPLERKRRGNWVLRILQIASLWAEKARRSSGGVEERKDEAEASSQGDCCCCDKEVCCVGDGEEAVAEFDKESFSKMLRRVPLAEAREYAKMSYLGNMAYRIPKIKVYE